MSAVAILFVLVFLCNDNLWRKEVIFLLHVSRVIVIVLDNVTKNAFHFLLSNIVIWLMLVAQRFSYNAFRRSQLKWNKEFPWQPVVKLEVSDLCWAVRTTQSLPASRSIIPTTLAGTTPQIIVVSVHLIVVWDEIPRKWPETWVYPHALADGSPLHYVSVDRNNLTWKQIFLPISW